MSNEKSNSESTSTSSPNTGDKLPEYYTEEWQAHFTGYEWTVRSFLDLTIIATNLNEVDAVYIAALHNQYLLQQRQAMRIQEATKVYGGKRPPYGMPST